MSLVRSLSFTQKAVFSFRDSVYSLFASSSPAGVMTDWAGQSSLRHIGPGTETVTVDLVALVEGLEAVSALRYSSSDDGI